MQVESPWFEQVLRDGKPWKFRASQLAYAALEEVSGKPLGLALYPRTVPNPEFDPMQAELAKNEAARAIAEQREPRFSYGVADIFEFSIDKAMICWALTASHRAHEGIFLRFHPDAERDKKDRYFGPFFTSLLPSGKAFHELVERCYQTIREDMGVGKTTPATTPASESRSTQESSSSSGAAEAEKTAE